MLALPPATNFISYRDGYGNLVIMSNTTAALLRDLFASDGTPALETYRLVIFDSDNSLGEAIRNSDSITTIHAGTKKGEPSCPDSPLN